ncbi:HIT family protein [Spirochaetota bacterium]
MSKHLFNTEKINYIKGDKPEVDCILCSIRDRSKEVQCLEVHRTDRFIISMNKYPFNPGHLMVFPHRHITDLRDLTDDEALEMHKLLSRSITILKKELAPSGFNVGFNIGNGSGASIEHVHQQIIPRYGNEINFIDVLNGTRVVVVDPVKIMDRLKEGFRDF